MVFPLLALAVSPFAPPQPWALGFAASPRKPFVGDVDGDGMADLIVVYPKGETIVDVSLTVEGAKAGVGFQGLPHWAGACRAATVGEFDEEKGTDVAGLFGEEVRLAGGFKDRSFTDRFLARLPKPLAKPALATLGRDVLAYSRASGDAFRIDPRTKTITPMRVPKGLVWIGGTAKLTVAQDGSGAVMRLDPTTFQVLERLGKASKDSRPAVGRGWVAFGQTVWTPGGSVALSAPSPLHLGGDPNGLKRHDPLVASFGGPFSQAKGEGSSGFPVADVVQAAGDIDGDGDDDLVTFRYGKEAHTGNEVLLRRFLSPGETDSDHDGLTNEEEAAWGADPLDPDTDRDGLLDGWEAKGYRGLDLPKLGCDPRHADLVCLVSRFDAVDPAKVAREFDRVKRFYAELKVANPDGKPGMHFVKVDLDPVTGEATKASWQANRDRFRPERWRGVVHWMQVTPGGGGQADELSDGGTCGEDALWATFAHEFGHQLGLNHEGFWPNGSCPIYSSMMNYNYSYRFEDDREKIHYSDGAFGGYILREDDLDETIPLPYEQVGFLSMGPYHYRLKPGKDGKTTLIDWNWNGIFGERHVRADVNYAYSTNAGLRDTVGKTSVAPWLFVHARSAYALYGNGAELPASGQDPTLSPTLSGKLVLRRLASPFKWDEPWTVAEGLVGDPVAASVGGKVVVAMPKAGGISLLTLDPATRKVVSTEPLEGTRGGVPSMGDSAGKPTLMVWNPKGGGVMVRPLDGRAPYPLPIVSTNPPGMCTDPKTGGTVVALGQDQDAARPNRWQIRHYDKVGKETSVEWVEGPDGQARGLGRLTLLFDASRDAGPKGRLYLFGKGMTDPSCTYVAMTLADKSALGGWLVKRYYDEWTQSRSAPAAAWFGGDILWGYRWFGQSSAYGEDDLHVGYRALGIQSEPFGDFDDLGFVRNFGAQHSLLTLGRA